jgi:hypothetical protein
LGIDFSIFNIINYLIGIDLSSLLKSIFPEIDLTKLESVIYLLLIVLDYIKYTRNILKIYSLILKIFNYIKNSYYLFIFKIYILNKREFYLLLTLVTLTVILGIYPLILFKTMDYSVSTVIYLSNNILCNGPRS